LLLCLLPSFRISLVQVLNFQVLRAVGNNHRSLSDIIVGNLFDDFLLIDLVKVNVTFPSTVVNETLIEVSKTTVFQ
jgi:hypothetical protein